MIMMIILLNKQIYKYRYDMLILLNYIKPYLSLHFLLCYGIAWSWHMPFYVGMFLGSGWFRYISITIITLCWTVLNESIWQVPIAVYLVRKLFPKDFKTKEFIERI